MDQNHEVGLVAALASERGQPQRLASIIRRSPPLMAALIAASEVAAPDWFVTAGAIRDAVWDVLHDRPPTAMPRDVDLSFFDPGDLTPARDAAAEAALRRRAPELPWEAKNQAAVHLWYPARFGSAVAPLASCAEAIATFPETASCVGVRLLAGGDLLIVAPYGLDDLLNGICRHNPTRVSARFYAERQAVKGWPARWPRVRYLTASADASRSVVVRCGGSQTSRVAVTVAPSRAVDGHRLCADDLGVRYADVDPLGIEAERLAGRRERRSVDLLGADAVSLLVAGARALARSARCPWPAQGTPGG
jgi:hypothetical protein